MRGYYCYDKPEYLKPNKVKLLSSSSTTILPQLYHIFNKVVSKSSYLTWLSIYHSLSLVSPTTMKIRAFKWKFCLDQKMYGRY